MWIFFAFGSAFFAGLTAILAKIGIRKTDATVATAYRTTVVLVFAWLMVAATNAQTGLTSISGKTWLFLILSGLATGASWLCFFHALQIGEINQIVPIDKASIVLTLIFSFLFLNEPISWIKGTSVSLIFIGTILMAAVPAETKSDRNHDPDLTKERRRGRVLAIFSALFAALTSILGKIGMQGIDSTLGTAIRTVFVLIMAWTIVAASGKSKAARSPDKNEILFIGLSGLATGASWLCFFKAIQDGPVSIVVPIDKLSILITILFSMLVFHEKLSRRAAIGLGLIVAATIALTVG